MDIEVSKLDVARRQLETAIRLFFYDGDFVSVHTLAAAAFNVLNDLSRKADGGRKSMRDQLLDYIPDKENKKLFIDEVRKTENFIKHADKDAGGTHRFDPSATTLFLIDAVRCYRNLTGEDTVLMQAYTLWFATEHPRVFVIPEEYREMLSAGSKLMAGISKSTFLELFLPLLMKKGV